MALNRGTRLGAYEIVSLVGAGGMGEVYQARDTRLDRMVAVKILPSSGAELQGRFEREAKAVAALSHPGIVAIFDFGSANGISYAVTELLQGATLRHRVSEGPLPPPKAIDYAIQIADALAAAHDHGIVHRDLKPENLFITRDDRVKILDFGLARHVVVPGRDTISPTMPSGTEPGVVLGTVGYMSPEQVRGEPATAASDIFSFGAVLYEMLTGQRAFRGESAAETMHAILKETPPELGQANVRPALDRIVTHCLEKSPDRRFHSAHDVAFALRAFSDVGSRPSLDAAGSLSRARPNRRAAIAACILVLAGGVMGVVADRALQTRTVEPPIFRRLTFERGVAGDARFAPDGNVVVYSAAWRGDPSEIFTTRLDSRESRTLGVPGRLFAISSKSELAVGLGERRRIAGTTLATVPLAGGAPREVLDGVTWADWLPDGTTLAVVRRLDDRQQVEFPIGHVVYETYDNITHLRASADGTWIAFAQHPPSDFMGAGTLVVVSRAGEKRLLSVSWADLFGIAWHPQRGEVWFTAAKRGEFKSLHAVTLDGKERLVARMLGQIDLLDIGRDGRVLLTQPNFRMEMAALGPGAAQPRDLTWLGMSMLADLSRDGRRVLFTQMPEGGGQGGYAYMRETDGTPAVRLGEGNALALSPDGKSALCQVGGRLAILPTGVGSARTLDDAGLSYLNYGSWFDDSRRIIFMARKPESAPQAYVQDTSGGAPQAVGPPGIRVPIVSPDGRSVAAASPNGPVLFTIGASDVRRCEGLAPGDQPVVWSADGRAVFFIRRRDQSFDLYRWDVSLGRATLVRSVTNPDPAGAGQSLSVAVTPDGKTCAYSFIRTLSELYVVDGLR